MRSNFLAATLVLPVGWSPVVASDACRVRTAYVTTPTYHAPTVTYPVATTNYQQYHYPVPVKVEVESYRYFGLADLYRDQLMVELGDKLLELQKLKNAQSSKVPVPPSADDEPVVARKSPDAPAKIPTDLDATVAKVLTESCVKCHAGYKDLSSLSASDRWEIAGRVNVGNMPKGKQPLPDEVVRSLFDWAAKSSVSTPTK
jgi:hypothetical protein